MNHTGARLVVLMGVSGSGKTTLGRLLAKRLGWQFLDADDLHGEHNIDLMRQGIPLTDADRLPWLQRVREEIDRRLANDIPTLVACSALRERYRDTLGLPPHRLDPRLGVVFLDVDFETLEARLAGRRGHFMPPTLLGSQLACLEPPSAPALRLDATLPRSVLCRRITRHFELRPTPGANPTATAQRTETV